MIKRKDMLKSAFNADSVAAPTAASTRVPSGAIRAMGLSLGRLSEDAARAEALEQQIAHGEFVRDLDPTLVEPSFVNDRLARTADLEFRRLVESISTTGQQVPILVRPSAENPGQYQVAYGHRRLSACLELGKTVKAIVRQLSDVELVVAQGKENAERRNLSFIERSQFASHLEQKGFERATIQAALAVHPAELTRLLAVARSIPGHIVSAIGPAPRAGRPRWMEFAKLMEMPGRSDIFANLSSQASFQRMSSDARFDIAIQKLRMLPSHGDTHADIIRNRRGVPVIRAERAPYTMRLIMDLKAEPGLDAYLLALLPALIADFEPK